MVASYKARFNSLARNGIPGLLAPAKGGRLSHGVQLNHLNPLMCWHLGYARHSPATKTIMRLIQDCAASLRPGDLPDSRRRQYITLVSIFFVLCRQSKLRLE